MEPMRVQELLTATGGTLLGGPENQDLEAVVTAVELDSRAAHEGALFVALRGEQTDGHRYISSAMANGAAGCLTARERESYQKGKFYIKVGNTQRALRDLAAWYKSRFQYDLL